MMTEKQLKALTAKIRSHQKALRDLDRLVNKEYWRNDTRLCQLAGTSDKVEREQYKKLERYEKKLNKIDDLLAQP